MKPWAGRFEKEPEKKVEEFVASISFDERLYKEDIKGSIAWAQALARAKVISEEEARKITQGLEEIKKEIDKGKFPFDIADEDIHMAIERALIEKIGAVGGKLHTGRSRNDQVATDLRMYLKKEIKAVNGLLNNLCQTIIEVAEKNVDIIMPGYTHLQVAQPVLFSHYIMAYFWMFKRDFDRMVSCFKKMDFMPLGSAAFAGTTCPINREFLAKELGFNYISDNSVDAVSDRDFILHFLSQSSILMVHLSRLAEELIIWSTQEFSFVELDDAYTTGSSIMPQKKNPDVAELIRGKAGRIFGNLMAMLSTMKGLPLSYHRDMQEDKGGLFDTIDTLKACLDLMSGILSTMKINVEAMKRALEKSFVNATDAADYLVRKGVPFREAHKIVGEMVKHCSKFNLPLEKLDLEVWKRFSFHFEEDVLEYIKIKNCLNRRDSYGSTAPKRVEEQLKRAKAILKRQKEWLS